MVSLRQLEVGWLPGRGLVTGKTTMSKNLESSAPAAILLGGKKKEGLKMKVILNHAYIIKPP